VVNPLQADKKEAKMYCSKCGTDIGDQMQCPNCGQPAPPSTQVLSQTVPTYLVWSILATIFCCLPGGIVAIIYSAMVSGKLAANDYAGALKASKNAKLWCWLSFGIGLALQIIGAILYIIGLSVWMSHHQDSNLLHL
jgi:hypothetical protein